MVVYSLTAFWKEMDRAKSVGWNLEFRVEIGGKGGKSKGGRSFPGAIHVPDRVGVEITCELITTTWVLAWLPKSHKRNYVRASG